jgi:hypothetical protein
VLRPGREREGKPPVRLEEKHCFDSLRSHEDVMRIVYSFLPVNERIHLGEVDKTFRDDKARGKIVAVYGEDNLDLLEAFQVLKRWKDFDDSPRSFEPGCSFGSVDPSWFTLEKGYDMQRAEVSDALHEN